jgi:hypothetical protein
MVSNQPIENDAKIAVANNTASMPAVNSDTGSVKLPTTEQLLAKVQQDQQADVQASPPVTPQPQFTPNSAVSSAPMPASETARRLDSVALMRAMSDFVKAQNGFIHNKELGRLAAAQELHIIALTTALEQLGVL